MFIILISVGAREAVNKNRQLKDTRDIVWCHDKDDKVLYIYLSIFYWFVLTFSSNARYYWMILKYLSHEWNSGSGGCHGPCSVTFFLKNNQRMAPTESPMMATSPLFSATLTIGHPHWNYIRPLSDFIPYSDTTNKSAFLSLPLPTSTMRYSTAAQPEPHHAPHTFHVSGQSYCARTSSRGHGFRLPQGLARIWVSILWHPSEYESFRYMFHSTTICSPDYLLICSCLYLYKYSSCSMYFASSNINLATYFS